MVLLNYLFKNVFLLSSTSKLPSLAEYNSLWRLFKVHKVMVGGGGRKILLQVMMQCHSVKFRGGGMHLPDLIENRIILLSLG